jgi:hypothetical protein
LLSGRDPSTFFIDKIIKFCGCRQQLDRFNKIHHQQQHLQYHGRKDKHHKDSNTLVLTDFGEIVVMEKQPFWHLFQFQIRSITKERIYSVS